ncbi:DHH family phosphoesterase [Salisediminibacterium beveridgei]|uniref:Bifunctional oligoribonuclease and PAP phosphatase nrnA n=1 Tax=Salisediminibacterium beveridgei TaxID=632773 RepID=A0A1D7QTB6_9BACI|nr:bifunctional oligoribonuclease/PAP phosphatase NrnA [Salisediminibacterium beveridgei]AOM82251.1 Bifunctional oligoribonuclease and PAP phosphatase nrnA [Salisediminibacterium beveridgei]
MKNEILDYIAQYDRIIILRHVRPDPDAIGSQAGLMELIKWLHPDKTVLMSGESDPEFDFLTRMDQVKDEEFEGALVIVCDTANRERIDDERFQKGAALIKIDHHPMVDSFGDVEWVDAKASSTSEMVYELFDSIESFQGKPPKPEMARYLYTGIVGDTGRFRFPNTTERTFAAAARLVSAPFSREEIYEKMYMKSEKMLRLEGYVLSSVEVKPSGAAVVHLPKSVLERFRVDAKEAAAIVNSFSALEGLKAWAFLVEEDDQIRLRMRSKGPEIHKLAEKYHGGGHPMAAGASAFTWEEAEAFSKELDTLCGQFV